MTPLQRWLRAGMACGIADFLWACGQTKFMYGGSITRLWQGVASVPLGASMLERGTTGVLAGVACHFLVAFTWAAIFVFVVSKIGAIQRLVASTTGAIVAAAVYGPVIWTAMSCLVIPSMTHRPPTINGRWFIQLAGHMISSARRWCSAGARGRALRKRAERRQETRRRIGVSCGAFWRPRVQSTARGRSQA